MIIIGERINSSRPAIKRAIASQDIDFIQNEALIQLEAGADYIDVNAGTFYKEEEKQLAWLVKTVQSVTEKPICIDTVNPKALLSGLKEHKGKALVNSISIEAERLKGFLPIIKEYSCRVIGLGLDDSGPPKSVEGKVKIADSLINLLVSEGLPPEDIFIDPLVHAISTDEKAALVTLQSIKVIKERHSEVNIICGVSNVSFGLPGRRKLNQVFLALAMSVGLNAAIIDPTDIEMILAQKCAEALIGQDEYCMSYLSHFREFSEKA